MAMLGATFVLQISNYWFSKISCIYSMLLTLEAKSAYTHFIADKNDRCALKNFLISG